MAIFLICMPIAVFGFLQRVFTKLGNDDFKPRFESLYLNINLLSREAIVFSTLFIARRMMFALVIVYLKESVVAQCFVTILFSILLIMYLTLVKPLNGKFFNVMEIFNEFTLMFCSYFCLLFTDFVDQ
jgi:hypothetical protein